MSSADLSSLWGPEAPFSISVPQEKLDKLQRKLELVDFPDELNDAGWDYGVPLQDIQRLLHHWTTRFDWRAQEKKLNESLPGQFTRDIKVADFGTLNIHYVHMPSKTAGAIPLLFCHGWPGSFVEASKIAALLTEASPEHPAFHFVSFDLPNYGFSEGVKDKGFAVEQHAEVGHHLMLSLGYTEYVTQGGDWGSIITTLIAQKYGPTHCKAFHTNYPMGTAPTLKQPLLYAQYLLTPYTQKEKDGLARTADFDENGRGYFFEHATKPQTIGYSLADSPVGLLAWIYEKLVSWTDDYAWTDDEVLTWISIYLFSRAGPAAASRTYYEFMKHTRPRIVGNLRTTIPYGVSYFPKEIETKPRIFQRVNANLLFEAEHDKGGHFAATEQPEALVGDLRKMFGKGGPAFGVVNGKTGY